MSAQHDKEHVCTIDDKLVSHQCLYGDTRSISIYPIGQVRTGLQPDEWEGLPEDSAVISYVELDAEGFDTMDGSPVLDIILKFSTLNFSLRKRIR